MSNSPILWGPNDTANNLQSQIATSRGELLQNDGPRNLIGYNRFENGLTTGWGLGTIGTLTNGIPTGTPTFGSGASGNLSISATSTTPIDGTYSLAYVSSAATTQGDMLHTDALPVNTGLQAKVITFKFYYQAISGSSNCNFSGTSSNSFGVAVYDVTNSSWLPVAGNFAMTQGSGVGIATGTMQTNATTASVRFCVYNVNATAGAATMYFDDFYLGPQTAPIGYVGTDAQAYTPTFSSGFGTVANIAVTQSRRGDKLFVQGTATTGTTASALYSISLPSVSIDTNKISIGNSTATPGQVIGHWAQTGPTGANGKIVTATATSATIVYFAGGSGGTTNATPFSGTGLLNNSTSFTFEFEVPIVGWSSNVQMSSDTDTRVVAASYYWSSSGAYTASTTMLFDTKNFDTHGAYNTSTGVYTIPVSGFYRTRLMVMSSSGTGGSAFTAKNSSVTGYHGSIMGVGNVQAGGTVTFEAKAGDQITFGVNGSYTRFGGASVCVFDIERLSGPAVIAATESVNARYTNTAGTAYSSGVEADLPFVTKDYDSHSGYNGTTFTCPVSGKYRVTAAIQTVPTSLAVSGGLSIFINKNGSRYSRLGVTNAGSTASMNYGCNGSDTINCNAGDTLVFRFISDANTSLVTSAGNNHMSIERVGN